LIPKIIHYCWLSGDPYSDKIAKCLESWGKYLPDYKIIKWDSKSFDMDRIQWTKEAFNEKKYAYVTDYLRFYILYNCGGIYLDADVEVLKSFNDLLINESFIGFEYTSVPEAAVIGAVKGCLWIKRCMDFYNTLSFYNKNGKQRMMAVPIYMRAIMERHYKMKIRDNGKIQKIDGMILYPYNYFSPKNYNTNVIDIDENTYCIHHFNNSWLKVPRQKYKKLLHNIISKIMGRGLFTEMYYQFHKFRVRELLSK
jgi:hypothetical protein